MNFRRRIFINIVRYSDFLLTILCFFGAHFVTHPWYRSDEFHIEDVFSLTITLREILGFLFILAAWNFIFARFGLHSSRRFSSWVTEIVDIGKIQCASVVAVLVASIFTNSGEVREIFLIAFLGFSTIAMISVRLAGKFILKQARRRGRNLRFMLIVGVNSRAIRFVRNVDARPDLGYRVIGFADTEDRMPPSFGEHQCSLVTTLDGLPDFLRTRVVDEVIICLPIKSFYQQASNIVSLCEKQGILVRYLSDVFNVKMATTRTDYFEGDSLVTLHSGIKEELLVAVKHAIDFVVSLILIVLLSPVLVAAAVAIKISSRGPVFFVQDRLGLNKRIFRIQKFRTMVEGAEQLQQSLEDRNEVDGPAFKIKEDPRITAVGRFLRRTSIDELPQLFNVFKGEMSLVGPRPLPVRDYNGFSEDWHRRRFSVRPGITCLWQINGRSNVSFSRWMELDIEYIDRWSLSLDFKILLKTIPAVIRGSGAV